MNNNICWLINNSSVPFSDALKIDPVKNPLDKLPAILKKNLNKNLCVCNEVLKMDIINAIINGATTVAEVKKQTYAHNMKWLLHLTGRAVDFLKPLSWHAFFR